MSLETAKSMADTATASVAGRSKSKLAYYIELTKPRILIMILVTLVIAMVAAGGTTSLLVVFHACIGTALVAASASVMNQWIEQERDGVMKRTCRRPLPAGRVASSQAAWMGWVLLFAGVGYLALLVNLPTMWCGVATWVLYVWVYTPLKMVSWTNTLIGTLPGALPVWMGWTAADGSLADPGAWVLLGIVVAWQLPHFMAIAYMYREQYESAGYKMITVTDPSGLGTALHAILGSIALVVLAVMAVPPIGILGGLLSILAVAVSVWMLVASIRFVRNPDMKSARSMLRVSLLHLPLTMLVVLLFSCLV
ncbi:MAG: heme o synthase [Aureliella sp.]